MISPIELIRLFRKERNHWKRHNLMTEYVSGIRYGLFIAIRITKELHNKSIDK